MYAALKGYLDWIPVDLVSVYEAEFYKFYTADVSYFPVKANLDFKDNFMDNDAVAYLVWYFTAIFIRFAIKNYKYTA